MQFFPRVCIQRTQELLVSVISFRFSPFQFYASCLLQVVYEFSLNEKLKREHLESPNSAELSMSPSFFRPLLSDANQVECEGSVGSNFMTPIFMSHFFAWEIYSLIEYIGVPGRETNRQWYIRSHFCCNVVSQPYGLFNFHDPGFCRDGDNNVNILWEPELMK